jgi:hypothetical protein
MSPYGSCPDPVYQSLTGHPCRRREHLLEPGAGRRVRRSGENATKRATRIKSVIGGRRPPLPRTAVLRLRLRANTRCPMDMDYGMVTRSREVIMPLTRAIAVAVVQIIAMDPECKRRIDEGFFSLFGTLSGSARNLAFCLTDLATLHRRR